MLAFKNFVAPPRTPLGESPPPQTPPTKHLHLRLATPLLTSFFFQFLTVSRTLHFKISGKRKRSTAWDVKTVRDSQDWTHAYFSVSPCCFCHTRQSCSSPWADEYSNPTELTPACINARVSSFPEREAPGKVHIRMMKRLFLNKGVTARIVSSTLGEIKMIFFLRLIIINTNTTLFPWEHSFIFLLGNCWRTSEEYTS